MRIGELSRHTGVPVPTIKYYVREELLHPGELTSPNQAHYDETHVRRLRLIRALTHVGKLPVADAKQVLAAVDDPERPLHKVLGAAQLSVTVTYESDDDRPDPYLADARQTVAELIKRHSWQVSPHNSAAEALAVALAALHETGHGDNFESVLDDYAAASERIAEADMRFATQVDDVHRLVEAVVVGTALGDAALAALRRLAQTDLSARRFPPGVDFDPGGTSEGERKPQNGGG